MTRENKHKNQFSAYVFSFDSAASQVRGKPSNDVRTFLTALYRRLVTREVSYSHNTMSFLVRRSIFLLLCAGLLIVSALPTDRRWVVRRQTTDDIEDTDQDEAHDEPTSTDIPVNNKNFN